MMFNVAEPNDKVEELDTRLLAPPVKSKFRVPPLVTMVGPNKYCPF
jgi:hypothetical protein